MQTDATQEDRIGKDPLPEVSIGIIAWNEEGSIPPLVVSLAEQTLFLPGAGVKTEVLVVANGCTDGTARVAEEQLGTRLPPGVRRQVICLSQRGKLNAWNQFVHQLSSKDARYLILMDADIILTSTKTLESMVETLRTDPNAAVAVDTPEKRFSAGSWRGAKGLSKGTAAVTAAAPAQLCGQLYCIRSEVARNIHLPRDLAACDDGFIKALVCTDFLTREIETGRIRVAPGAAHSFEAYTSPGSVLRNQKRQIIGQTIVHLLIDKFLPTLPEAGRARMAVTLNGLDAHDPDWLKRLIAEHLSRTKLPWRLFPNLLTHRWRHYRTLPTGKKLISTPGLAVSFGVSLLASFMAYAALKRGSTDYWPGKGKGAGTRHQGHGRSGSSLGQRLSTLNPRLITKQT